MSACGPLRSSAGRTQRSANGCSADAASAPAPKSAADPERTLTIIQGEGARYFSPAVDIALPTTQGISAVPWPPTAAATQPSDNAV